MPTPREQLQAEEKSSTSLERSFKHYWRLFAGDTVPNPEQKIVLFKARRFEYDFVWMDEMVAVELQGGTFQKRVAKDGTSFVGTGHASPSGIRRDAEKNNLAQRNGWLCLHYTTEMLGDDPQGVIAEIVEILLSRRLT